MKRIQLILIGILTCFILFSCEKETLLSVDQTSLSFTDTGGSQTVSLTANKQWAASSNQSWCKVSPSSGEEASSSRITITCDANTSYDARNCAITFTCAEKTTTVNVSQATNNGLLVSQTSFEVTKAAQQLNIQVQANVKFSVEVDNGCKDWVKYNTTKGLTTSTVVLDIAENKTYDSREGKVTIKQDGGNLSSTINIKQSQLDGLFITTPEYNLSNEKHTLTVDVSTNVEFDVTPEADWVKYVQTKGLSSKQIILEVAENDTFDQRGTIVNVKQKNGDLNGVITIKQDEKFGLFLSQTEFDLSNNAHSIDVEVKANVDYDIVIPSECKGWIKLTKTKSLNTRNCTFSISKNETYDAREGSITFKQKNGALSGTVSIKQAQTDAIIVEQEKYSLSYEEQQLSINISSNVDYEVIIDEECTGWINRVSTKGLKEESILFQVAENEGDGRLGKITFKNETIQKTVLVQQQAGIVVFEDDNFKAYCVSEFDNNMDGNISYKEARYITRVFCSGRDISSLRGIEHFTNLNNLSSSSNKLTHLDLSNNLKLRIVNCGSNRITYINISQCLELEELDCGYNRLTSLDVRNNTCLQGLGCGSNALSNLDVSNNNKLKELGCSNNQLSSIDISKNPLLEGLVCENNQITKLDISNNPKIKSLICNNNQLSDLILNNNKTIESIECSYNKLTIIDISDCVQLQYMSCYGNQLINLDISKNVNLEALALSSNKLTKLDTKNNTWLRRLRLDSNCLTSLDVSNNILLEELYCLNNPNLTEIWLKEGQYIPNFNYNNNITTIKYK